MAGTRFERAKTKKMASAPDMEGITSPDRSETENRDEIVAVELPAPQGWIKKFTPKKGGALKRKDIVFISPTGEEITSKMQLEHYLKSHSGGPSSSEFDWGTGETPRRSPRISDKVNATESPEAGAKGGNFSERGKTKKMANAPDMESIASRNRSETEKREEIVAGELPAPQGWIKKFTPKKGGALKRKDIVFISPTGEEIRSKMQLEQYLKSHSGGPSSSEFDWGTGETPRRSPRISDKVKATESLEAGAKGGNFSERGKTKKMANAPDMESIASRNRSETEKREEIVAGELPAPQGWIKKFTPKKGGALKRNDIVFISPTGEEIRSKVQLEQYLKSHSGGPSSSEFDWGSGEMPRRSARISDKVKATEVGGGLPEKGIHKSIKERV